MPSASGTALGRDERTFPVAQAGAVATVFAGDAALETRRLGYFRKLLRQGYQSAMRLGPPSGTLRAERLTIGIDLPELDAVPLWSMRRQDGSVSIPFIEYALTRVRATLEALAKMAAPGPEKSELLRNLRALDRLLDQASFYGATPAALPRLGDLFLPSGLVARLCAPGGLLDRIAAGCEMIRPGREFLNPPGAEGHPIRESIGLACSTGRRDVKRCTPARTSSAF